MEVSKSFRKEENTAAPEVHLPDSEKVAACLETAAHHGEVLNPKTKRELAMIVRMLSGTNTHYQQQNASLFRNLNDAHDVAARGASRLQTLRSAFETSQEKMMKAAEEGKRKSFVGGLQAGLGIGAGATVILLAVIKVFVG